MDLTGSYDYAIVGLSFVIAVLASYAALNMTAKISYAAGRIKLYWLLAGAFVMGSGVWSMHFVGMLAFHTHLDVDYDVWLTFLSMCASVIASFIAFYITMPKHVNWVKLGIGGFVMGGGIVAMHYIGMEAMVMEAELTYNRVLWVISAIIALAASYAALFLFLRFRNQAKASSRKWLSAVIMGIAVCGMHYTGMTAAEFHVHDPHAAMDHASAAPDLFLLYGVTVMIFLVLLVSWGAMYLDRHVLERMAYQDTVTGLPNRNEMNRYFRMAQEGEGMIAFLFLDLDRFKAINDTLGHHVGDLLVKEAAGRLSQIRGDGCHVFRIGGDEFLITAADCDAEQAERLADDLLKRIKMMYSIDGHELYVTASIGISIGSAAEADPAELLKAADTAMYKAKGMGKNRYCLYTDEMGVREVRKMELEKDMQGALAHQQFRIVYQPKWNVRTDRLYGFEALMRWEHPRLGLVSPGEFIPIAEETGLIVPMTRWALEEACRQGVVWKRQGIAQPVSVNMSVRLFHIDGLTDMIRDILERTGLEPEYLELEITESMVLYDINEVVRQLREIRGLGVRVSMDDFGTGYSSIGLLDRLPIDALKLDRLFTRDLDTPSKRAIIHAIVLMAENLHLDVIAEGVENREHIEFLTQLGCYVMQGYYYAKPMPSDSVGEWLRGRMAESH